MTLNFQNKIVFPAPEHSYTPETAYGQVIYIPRNMTERRLREAERLRAEEIANAPTYRLSSATASTA